jgi:ATP-dependent helicase/nuclease subunit A
MSNGTLTIYSASAGSGKTYRLTGIYLVSLFRSRYQYRKILAVTFTHKATAEMKSRILDNLNRLASGNVSEYLGEIMEATSRNEAWIRAESRIILNSILHDFSRFSVSTIDSFFQKILRAFTREIGLHSGFNIELDHSFILASAVDEMIASASSDPHLKEWLTSFALANIDDEKSWNLKDSILTLSQELFKEKFKILPVNDRAKLEDKKFLLLYVDTIRKVISEFESILAGYGKEAESIFSEYCLDDDMFYRKGQGVPRWIKLLNSGIISPPNSYIREITNNPPRWSTGSVPAELQNAISGGLDKVISDSISYYDSNIINYKTAGAILNNVYALGILSDVLLKVHEITTGENSFLLSDAGELLNGITGGDQSPFIYEKVGNLFETFMIDEFQDTSAIQWNNFSPLIANSMAEGHDNLVVGDVKQSIYRWRNSDWKILGDVLDKQIDNERIIAKSLTTNWRCRSNIISFNNQLFSTIPAMIDNKLESDSLSVSFKKLYSEAVQKDPLKKDGGYVRIEFEEDEKENRWQEKVLAKLPDVIENVQSKGYNASDIGIIVRDGREGAMVLKKLIDYRNGLSDEKASEFNFNAVSNDSLLLSNSPVVNFIISVLSVVNDPSDVISKAMMIRFFLLSKGTEDADKYSLVYDKSTEVKSPFPDGYKILLDQLNQLPLFEATEKIIKFFSLGEHSWNVPYLNSFQDFVVSFSGEKSSDIESFLIWWNVTGCKKSVVLPGNQDAIRILTIHKSKGLEFSIVILPFLSWNLDHTASKQPVLWVRPQIAPFSEMGIMPVRYGKELAETIFAGEFNDEKHSVYLDNINLLYVALTRAKDAVFGFSVNNPRSENTIARILKDALSQREPSDEKNGIVLSDFYNTELSSFEYGTLPDAVNTRERTVNSLNSSYHVSSELESLKLKLHGENYFSSEHEELRKKINYGKLMHRIFESVFIPSDVFFAVRRLVIEGALPEDEALKTEERVNELISSEQVREWFMDGNEVLNETGIIMPDGNVRRPDRVILKDGKTIVIDFKFGNVNPRYSEQVELYGQLLVDMGYINIEAYIWYVDKNLIIPVNVRSK